MDEKLASLNTRTALDVALQTTLILLSTVEAWDKSKTNAIQTVQKAASTQHDAASATERLRSGQEKFVFFDSELFMMESAQPGGKLDQTIAKLGELRETLIRDKRAVLGRIFQSHTRNTVDMMHDSLLEIGKVKTELDVADSELLEKALEYLARIKERLAKVPEGEIGAEVGKPN